MEADIETAARDTENGVQKRLSPAELEVLRLRDGLRLSRSQVLQDLATSRNERYRGLLREKLAHLEAELAKLEPQL